MSRAGKIFKIYSSHTKKIYIGSTWESLNSFLKKKKKLYEKWQRDSSRSYHPSYKILKYTDAKIKLVENYACDTSPQLLYRQTHHIAKTKNCVNVYNNPNYSEIYNKYSTAHKEYRDTHKKEISIYNRKYSQEHRAERKEYYSKLISCDYCGKMCRRGYLYSGHNKGLKHLANVKFWNELFDSV